MFYTLHCDDRKGFNGLGENSPKLTTCGKFSATFSGAGLTCRRRPILINQGVSHEITF